MGGFYRSATIYFMHDLTTYAALFDFNLSSLHVTHLHVTGLLPFTATLVQATRLTFLQF